MHNAIKIHIFYQGSNRRKLAEPEVGKSRYFISKLKQCFTSHFPELFGATLVLSDSILAKVPSLAWEASLVHILSYHKI